MYKTSRELNKRATGNIISKKDSVIINQGTVNHSKASSVSLYKHGVRDGVFCLVFILLNAILYRDRQ